MERVTTMALNKTQIKKLADRIASREFGLRVERSWAAKADNEGKTDLQKVHHDNAVMLEHKLDEDRAIVRLLGVEDQVELALPEAREEWS